MKARRTFGIVALALAASFLAGCGRPYTSPDPYSGNNGSSNLPQTPQLPSGTVVGRVVDSLTGLGVADVEVSVLGVMPARSTRTNGAGEFTLSQVPASKVKLSLYKQGYTYLASFGDVVVEVLAGNTVTAPQIQIAAYTDAVTNAFVTSFGNLDQPRGIAIDDTNGFIYVTSKKPYKFYWNPVKVWSVRKFNRSGGVITDFADNLFWRDLDDPQGMTVTQGGNVFIADPGKGSTPIRQYSTMGEYIEPVSNANEFGGLSKPYDITVMRSGAFGISSAGNNQVKFFAQNRSTPAKDPSQADLKLKTNFSSGLRGITVDANDNIYVIDVNAGPGEVIRKFDANGNLAAAFGYVSPSRAGGYFSNPTDLAVDNRNGEIYVVDAGNNRIQRFNYDGSFISEFGGHGGGNGKFSSPHSIAIDKEGFIYVSDTGNNRIQKFAPSRLQQVGQNGF